MTTTPKTTSGKTKKPAAANKTAAAKTKADKAAGGTPTKTTPAKTAAPKKAPAKRSTAKASQAKTAATKSAASKSSAAKSTASKRSARKTSAKSSAKPWLKSYPKNMPAEMGPPRYSSLAQMIDRCFKEYAERPAFTCMDKTLTYADLDAASKAFAAYLQSTGLKKGDRVALMMPNILQYPVALAGVLRAGMTVVNVNPLYTPRELQHQLKDSGASAIVILENFAHTLEQVAGKTDVKHVIVTAMGDLMGLKGHIVNFVVRKVKKMVPAWSLPGHTSFKSALSDGRGKSLKSVSVGMDDVAFLQYTGGTTGVSKGAVLTHGNVLANVQQNSHWVSVAYAARGKPDQVVYMCALPLYHIFALTVNAVMGIDQGGHNILIPNPRDIPAFVKEMAKYDWNFFAGLNTLFNALLNNEDFRKLDFSHVRLVMGGGMAVQKPVADRWKEVTGTVIYEGYGLSETSPVATANRFDAPEFTGTIGLPLPSTEIAIRDDDGKDLPLGEVGEICIRGPQVMAGYWNRPDETAKVMTKDGFFRSGDMGFMDKEGRTKIVDRKKDMILVSGFNVYPNEVEEVAAGHPGIVEAAAVGMPDEHSGEAVKLFVVRKDPKLSADDIKKYCAENLTNYKRPKVIEFRDELPKTNVGKILRRELR